MHRNFSYFFRCLLPSWRFYQEVTSIPRLRLRGQKNDGEVTDWVSATQAPKQSLSMLFFNPQGNLTHAINSLLQQLEVEIGELRPDLEDGLQINRFDVTPSFDLLKRLVEYSVKQLRPAETSGWTSYQFLLERLHPLTAKSETILLSKLYPFEAGLL